MGWFKFTTGVDTTDELAGLKVDAEDISFTLNEVAAATTLTADHFFVVVDASSGNINLTLPAIADSNQRMYTVKKIDSSSNKVTLVGTIDNEENIDLNLQNQYVTIVGSSVKLTWFIIGGEYVKMEDLLAKLLNEQIELLEKIRQEATKITLHQASQSDENIGEKDAQ